MGALLFYDAALVLTDGFGEGTGPALLDSLSCTGNENNLLECGNGGQIGDTRCTSSRGAGVSCQSETC